MMRAPRNSAVICRGRALVDYGDRDARRADARGARSEGPRARHDLVRVALGDPNLLELQAELVGQYLAEHRFVSLAVAAGAHGYVQLAGGVHLHPGALEGPNAGPFGVEADAHAYVASVLRGFPVAKDIIFTAGIRAVGRIPFTNGLRVAANLCVAAGFPFARGLLLQ